MALRLPNLLITMAPAVWTFVRPYFLQPGLQFVASGAYLMALHMCSLVR